MPQETDQYNQQCCFDLFQALLMFLFFRQFHPCHISSPNNKNTFVLNHILQIQTPDSPMLHLYSHNNTYTNDHRYHTHRYLHLTGRHTHHPFDLSFSLFTIFIIIKQHLFSCQIVHYPGKGSCRPYIRLFKMSSLIPL